MSKAELIQEIIENLARCQRPALNSPAWHATGLSHAQMSMLYMIFYHREVSPKDIVDYLGISKSAVSQMVEPLVDKGLVDRRYDPEDRRIIRLSLSAKGKQAVQKIIRLKSDGLRTAFDSLNEAEVKQLYALHQKMFANIKQKEKLNG